MKGPISPVKQGCNRAQTAPLGWWENFLFCLRLVDHLVEAGKRAVPLEKHAEKEARNVNNHRVLPFRKWRFQRVVPENRFGKHQFLASRRLF